MPYKGRTGGFSEILLHPEQQLERLLEKMPKSSKGILAGKRLRILDCLCRQYYESGGKDFSSAVLGPRFVTEAGVDDTAIIRSPYKLLMQAWAKLAGGEMLHPKWLRSEQVRRETGIFIDDFFNRYNRLPSCDTIRQQGMVTFNNGAKSQAARAKHIKFCVKEWGRRWLADVPEKALLACEQLFSLKNSIPTASTVRTSISEQPAIYDDAQLNIFIEKWRQHRFAIELWEFSPSSDESDFRWLLLHPELAAWRPLVLAYLSKLVSPSLMTRSKIALHTFLVEYLFDNKLPLTPMRLLSKSCNPPSFTEICFKNICIQEVESKERAVDGLIEYSLERGDGFFVLDNHGHRIRSDKYHNPFRRIEHENGVVRKRRRKSRLRPGSLKDPQLNVLTELNPKLEQWRIFAISWLSSIHSAVGTAQKALTILILDYIVIQRLPTDPSILLSREWQKNNTLPSYRETALKKWKSRHSYTQLEKAVEFLDYVLNEHYSAEDDHGRRIVSGDYNNFLKDQADTFSGGYGWRDSHSNKDVLPSRYIRYLRDLICPIGARNFEDFKWAQSAVPFGDWLEVDPQVIDPADPDCVWRIRTVYESRGNKKLKRDVHEIWSPVRAVALLVKLELPLRTYQVRLLDSGEADSWRYEGSTLEVNSKNEFVYRAGAFAKSQKPLAENTGKVERNAGVFRRMHDSMRGKFFTGLYINTNKTNDQGKEKWDRGYVVQWQHGKVLYWCERLRNWQEKYNPVNSLVPCIDLPAKILGDKAASQKQQMGEMCFLFRDAVARKGETSWPITDAKVSFLWERVLKELEVICAAKGHKAADGSPLRFIYEDKRDNEIFSARFSLHSLRVSLITHFATEGGVEMHILSECIAGHARILMTLYYKKSGVVYVSEAMDAASERLRDEAAEQENWIRWIKEASLKQLEMNSAAVDISVLELVQRALSRGGVSLLRTNLGLCAKGGMACESGGVIVDEDTAAVSFGPVSGYPEKNCVRCRWFLTGPAFLHALVHHWNLLHFNLGDNGGRYLAMSEEVAKLESAMLDCQRRDTSFEHEARLENLRHALSSIYDGNEKLAFDSLATMKLIVRCKQIIDSVKQVDSGVALVAVGGMEEVTISMRECSELEQILTAAIGSTLYVDEDAHKAALKAGNAFDRMLSMNGMEPIFFKLSENELPAVVAHMTRLFQAYAGSIGRAVPFIEGAEMLSKLELFGDTESILSLASAGTPLYLNGSDERGPILVPGDRKVIPISLACTSDVEAEGE